VSVLSDAEAKRYLQVSGTWDADRTAELSPTIAAAEKWVAGKCGPLEPTTIEERLSGGTDTLTLSTTPVLTVTSVTPVLSTGPGTVLTAGAVWARLSSGLIQLPSGGTFSAREYDVEYVAGYPQTPPDLLQAVKAYLLYLWLIAQRGTNTRAPSARTFLDQAESLIEDYVQIAFS
jgi:hypothetical protein